ncbi:MAG: SCO6745 family protein [Acidimicrobiales bacterium]
MSPTKSTPRRFRDLVEPIAANVYFAPEAQEAYAELGLSYLPGYVCSRGGCMGQVPGQVIASTFAVFDPDLIINNVTAGWELTTAEAVLPARLKGAIGGLTRIIGEHPDGLDRATDILRRAGDAATLEGHPIYAGLRSLDWPGDPLGDMWRAADLVREHRGDSHNCAWVSHGVGPVEITLLSELWWGIPPGSYVRTRGWSPERIEEARQGLASAGLVVGDEITDAGRELRESIERATDKAEESITKALGDDADELFSIIEPWSRAIIDSGGYPADPSKLGQN